MLGRHPKLPVGIARRKTAPSRPFCGIPTERYRITPQWLDYSLDFRASVGNFDVFRRLKKIEFPQLLLSGTY
jgi:hypothetical protein